MLHELPDLFCEHHDALDVEAFRAHNAAWMNDNSLSSISDNVRAAATKGELTAHKIEMRLSNRGEYSEDAVRFACLRGLDAAFQEVNAVTSSGARTVLNGLKARGATGAQLDSGQHGGALLLRTRASPRATGPEHPRDAFTAVVRVPPEYWEKGEHVVLPESAMLHRHDITGGITVACAPVVADPDEMVIEADERDGIRVYRIGPANQTVTHARIKEVVAAMRGSGARVGIAPEATLTPELLETWCSELRATSGQGDRLHWVLAGSGDLDGQSTPVNAAVLLDAHTGDVLVRQDKIYRFDMDSATLDLWSLTDLLGDAKVREDMSPGHRLKIIDGGGIRLAILVCEDAGRLMDLGAVVRSFAVSHVLMPVFSRPLAKHRWEQGAGDAFAAEIGATTIVANSQVQQTLASGKKKDRGSAMVVTPEDVRVGDVSGPQEVAVFTLHADGSVTNHNPA